MSGVVEQAVNRLVPLSREIVFDDTMNEVTAVLRMDAKLEEPHAKVQFLIDFRHKQDKWKSKPRFYGTLSQVRQFEDLVSASVAMSAFHRLNGKPDVTRLEIEAHIGELFSWVKRDAVVLTEILLADVKKRVHVYPVTDGGRG